MNKWGYQEVLALAVVAMPFLLAIVGIGGWVANIVKLSNMEMAAFSGMLILRAIGIVIAPLGAVLGFC